MKELDEDFDLQLLLNMTELLASCAEGDNLSIESVCQTGVPHKRVTGDPLTSSHTSWEKETIHSISCVCVHEDWR